VSFTAAGSRVRSWDRLKESPAQCIGEFT
jgi:hypothetical protein